MKAGKSDHWYCQKQVLQSLGRYKAKKKKLSCGLLPQPQIVCIGPEKQWLQAAVTQKEVALPSHGAVMCDRYTSSAEGELGN